MMSFNENSDIIRRTCARCGNSFYIQPMERWKTLCISCWKKTKGVDNDITSQQANNYKRIKQLEDEVIKLRAKLLEYQLESIREKNQKTGNNQFDAETLKRIRILCHPDKHNNSELSNKISKLLNNML